MWTCRRHTLLGMEFYFVLTLLTSLTVLTSLTPPSQHLSYLAHFRIWDRLSLPKATPVRQRCSGASQCPPKSSGGETGIESFFSRTKYLRNEFPKFRSSRPITSTLSTPSTLVSAVNTLRHLS